MNKYNAKKTEYNGIVYHSKKEADYAYELDMRVIANDIRSWNRQIPFQLKVNNKLICKIIIDFIIVHNDDTKELVEVKGMETREYKIKKKLFEALYPTLKLTVVK